MSLDSNNLSQLLSRDEFRQLCLYRDHNQCVICGSKNGLSVHHIIERHLWDDGGYYESNGATLCQDCHLKAEMTTLTVEEIRKAIGILSPILPPGLNPEKTYEKWGNEILPDGTRLKGLLFNEPGTQKILKQGSVLHLYVDKVMHRDIIKYPRTPHIEGSRFQNGDEDMDSIPFSEILGKHLVIEEKIDGASSAVSFDNDKLHLQSRGHYLTGGDKAHFHPFKQWANTYASVMQEVLGERYIMYGEWMYAKHTCFYDALPHYFMEFDIYDTEAGMFLNTPRRNEMLEYMRLYMRICSVPVLASGTFDSLQQVTAFIGPSLYKSSQWMENLKKQALASGVSWEDSKKETNMSDLCEGLYIKHEDDQKVVGRFKFVRGDFLNSILDSGTHWDQRPIVPNMLAPGVDLFG